MSHSSREILLAARPHGEPDDDCFDLSETEVADPGPGFEFEGRADDPGAVEGWGLYLVATLADRWAVERNLVWFELDRSPGLGAAA